MKKVLYVVLIVVLLIFAGIYIFIPKNLKISSAIIYKANREGVFHFLVADSNWAKWWPGEILDDDNGKKVFAYSGHDYRIQKLRYHALELSITQSKKSYNSLLKVMSFKTDSVGIEIDATVNTGNDPLSRVLGYSQAKKIKKSFDGMLVALRDRTSTVKDLYGYDIKNEKVQMQFLLSTNKVFPHYPTTEDIYSLVGIIREHISKTDGKEEFFPMLNIESKDSTNYFVRVGVPVNKKLPGGENVALMQMVKDGNILVTEVKGDPKTINKAIKQVEKYISDYQRSIIAIPFQSLETDRSKEPDSSKWITKIYYPVV